MLVSSAKNKKNRNLQDIDDIAQRADILSLELLDLHCISLQFQLFSQNYPPELITVSLKHLETLAEMIYVPILLTVDCEVIKNNNFPVRTVKQCSKTKTLQTVLILRVADSCRFPANRTNAITHVSLFVSCQRNDIQYAILHLLKVSSCVTFQPRQDYHPARLVLTKSQFLRSLYHPRYVLALSYRSVELQANLNKF